MPDKPKKKPENPAVPKRKTKVNVSGAKPRVRKQIAFGPSSDAFEQALLTGEDKGLLEDYFGPENYSRLRELARDAAARSVRGGPRVLILPGIMGSTLGRRGILNTQNILWLDPAEIALGRLTELKLSGASSYHAVGVILLAYLKLKLKLKIAGFDADFFPYDWRLSLTDAGASLAEALRKETASQISLVAHSMGGLVARMALAQSGETGKKVAKLIMLGTPNYGSFAPVQVIRGTYPVVQQIAKVDLRHSADQLCSEVFCTFPGLYEMLPAAEKFTAVDLFDLRSWPGTGARPQKNLLTAVKPILAKLAPADSRFFLIAGVNQETVTGLHVTAGEFVYEISSDGDGTVPLAFARLADIPEKQIYYVEEGHGSLPNNGVVEAAVVDLLSSGVTAALPNQRPAAKRAVRLITERAAREMATRMPGIGQMGSSDYRHLLDPLVAPPREGQEAGEAAMAAIGASVPEGAAGSQTLSRQFQNLTIGRRRQRRIEMTLVHGSITDVDAQAYVLGVFQSVAPSGAALAIDRRLNGAIAEFTARRMFGGEVGAVFAMPVGRSTLAADTVLFAGLGTFDRFTADVQQLVAENVIRVLIRSRVNDFATILMGAGSGQGAASVLQNLLVGFFRGLKDADPRHRFRGITLCEFDAARFAEMKKELYQLAGTSLFDDVELTLDEIEIPSSELPTRALEPPGKEPVYTIIRQEGRSGGQSHFRVSVLGSGMKAAVVSAPSDVDEQALASLLQKFDAAVAPGSNFQDVQQYGARFSELVLPPEIRTVLASMKDRHIVVVHDAPAARIPWETLTIRDKADKTKDNTKVNDNTKGWSAALECGLSRRYLADHLAIATWLEERRAKPSLKLLLIVNPLGDLPGAEEEGDRIAKLAGTNAAIEVTQLRNKEATKPALLSALRTGKYDCVHYAGHAFFDPEGPGRSGLVCAGREILSGSDLMGISNLPFLVFFNACEAGRVRGAAAPKSKPASAYVEESAGVAEALMRGGVGNYMSTYWPVGDSAATAFSTAFYQSVLAGNTIGEALLKGRKAVFALGNRDWADYVLYGSYDFKLKQGSGAG